jgi:pyrroloquinoline quinone biosynthesis protein B
MKKATCIFFLLTIINTVMSQNETVPCIFVLGITQDGGYPHTGCRKNCCINAWKNDSLKRFVVSLALIDPSENKWWLFEATPDIKEQLHYFQTLTKGKFPYLPEGIFITHAHIGHYTGLMQLGREVMSSVDVPVYVLPRMKEFLENNGPWSQLVKLKNIVLYKIDTSVQVNLNREINIKAFTVPHRDEYSETGGFKIITKGKTYLFIPDIDKWEKWGKNIVSEVSSVDIALLDGTFFDMNHLSGRNISDVPHPFVNETMELFKNSEKKTKAKIFFIHLNHSNALLWDKNTQYKIKEAGFNIAGQGNTL